jgi:hypothetical protein
VIRVRARYAIAVGAAAVWLFAFSLVSHDWGSLLQLAGVTVGGLIFGAIAWPDDFRRNPRVNRERSPEG